MKRLAIFIIGMLAFAFPARADKETIAQISSALTQIDQRNPECKPRPQFFGRLVSDEETLQFWVYTVSQCGTGNNAFAYHGAFRTNENSKVVPVFAKGVDKRILNWTFVKKVEYLGEAVVVDAVTAGPDDPSCCPTQGRRVVFFMDGLELKVKQTKAWIEKNE